MGVMSIDEANNVKYALYVDGLSTAIVLTKCSGVNKSSIANSKDLNEALCLSANDGE